MGTKCNFIRVVIRVVLLIEVILLYGYPFTYYLVIVSDLERCVKCSHFKTARLKPLLQSPKSSSLSSSSSSCLEACLWLQSLQTKKAAVRKTGTLVRLAERALVTLSAWPSLYLHGFTCTLHTHTPVFLCFSIHIEIHTHLPVFLVLSLLCRR